MNKKVVSLILLSALLVIIPTTGYAGIISNTLTASITVKDVAYADVKYKGIEGEKDIYSSISKAMENTAADGKVYVAPGMYSEDISSSKNIELEAQGKVIIVGTFDETNITKIEKIDPIESKEFVIVSAPVTLSWTEGDPSSVIEKVYGFTKVDVSYKATLSEKIDGMEVDLVMEWTKDQKPVEEKDVFIYMEIDNNSIYDRYEKELIFDNGSFIIPNMKLLDSENFKPFVTAEIHSAGSYSVKIYARESVNFTK